MPLKILISTDVEQSLPEVWAGFDRQLFTALAPPLMPMQVLRFDGCLPGDEVHIRMGVWPLLTNWNARIIDQSASKDGIYFVDEGFILPPGMKYWRHKHQLTALESGTRITDDIEFGLKWWILIPFLYPALFLGFYMRKPVYQRIFRKRPGISA